MKRAETRIGPLHHVGGGNLGDAESVADGITQRWPEAEIFAFSMNPDDTETRRGIKSHPIRRNCWSIGYKSGAADGTSKAGVQAPTRKRRHVSWLLKSAKAVICFPSETFRELSFWASSRHTMKSFDLLIISGGSQLTDKDGPWGFRYTIFKWVVLARSAGARCAFLNVGAGPLTQPSSRFFVRRALLAADDVSLRDNKPQELIRRLDLQARAECAPIAPMVLEVAAVRGSARETSSQSIVGLAPMDCSDPDPGGYQAEKDRIVYDAFIRKLQNFGWRAMQDAVLGLPHSRPKSLTSFTWPRHPACIVLKPNSPRVSEVNRW